MKLVCAALADLIEDDAANPILRREGGCADLHLLHRLKDRDIRVRAMGQRRGCAIRKDAAVRKIAVDRYNLPRTEDAVRLRRSTLAARQQNGEVLPILPYLGKLGHLLGFKRCSLLAVLCLQKRDVGTDDNRFGHRANVQLRIDRRESNLQRNGRPYQLLESSLGEGDLVCARNDRRRVV